MVSTGGGSMTLAETFDQIERELGAGMVPRIFRLLEGQPTLLTHLWGQFRTIVLQGELPRVLKEMVGLVVASITHCDYVRVVHLHSLTIQGVDAKVLQALREGNLQPEGVSALTAQALKFAVLAASTRSSYGDGEADTLALWQPMRDKTGHLLGSIALEEGEKFELVATVALFEQICTVANLLALDPNQP